MLFVVDDESGGRMVPPPLLPCLPASRLPPPKASVPTISGRILPDILGGRRLGGGMEVGAR